MVLLAVEIYRTCKFTADDSRLRHNGLSLSKRRIYSRIKILRLLHLRNTEAASAVGRLHEHRESETFHSLLSKPVSNLAFPYKYIIRTFHEIHILEIALA